MQYVGVIGIALLLAGLGAAYVLYPLTTGRLIKGKDSHPEMRLADEPDGLRRELTLAQEERDRAYSGLAELDHDFFAGDLNQEDYHQLRAEYKDQAVEALVDLDRLETRVHEVGDEIEQAVARVLARARLSKKTGGSGAASQSSSLKSRPGNVETPGRTADATADPDTNREAEPLRLGRFCSRCGHEAEISAIYCARCGMKLARLED